MKPDWNNAPSWANWLAQDECGQWFWHELEPEFDPDSGFWLSERNHYHAGDDRRNSDAFDTLEQRPTTTHERRDG